MTGPPEPDVDAEHARVRALLADLGCEDIQGYLFSRPLPEEEVTALLTRNRL